MHVVRYLGRSRHVNRASLSQAKRFGTHVDWNPPDYRRDGFPVTDHKSPEYDPKKDPFRYESFGWLEGGPELMETDWDDPRRIEVLSEIPVQYKSVTQRRAFMTIKNTIVNFHRFKLAPEVVLMDARFVEDLGLDSLDVNELSVYWEHEFNIIGSNRGHQGGGEAGGCNHFNEYDVQEWRTVGDVVEYLCELPTAMVNIPETPDHDECYDWDHTTEPKWGMFTERVNNDGTLGKPNYNPSGLPEFEHRNVQKRLDDSFPKKYKTRSGTLTATPLDPKGYVEGDKFGYYTPNGSIVIHDDH